ncbi:MAG: GIY-YIG nuclease family protein [Candidatus Marinimicrobia bacterium]|nr:GIY-YIG nuclease family protein [Candidatus Neomarinimicrobiota bacterium]
MSSSVYVLKSNEGYIYVSITDNLERRLKEHNSGQSRYTKKGTGWKVIYQEERPSRVAARSREKYFKSHAGKEWLMRRDML